MKKATIASLSAALIISAASASAAITLGGTSIRDGIGVSAGDTGVLLVSTLGDDFSSLSLLKPDLDLSIGSSFDGFQVVGNSQVSLVFGSTALSFGDDSFELGGGVDVGDQFGILVFDASSDKSSVGDSFSLFRGGDWTIPVDGIYTFGSDFVQIDGASPILRGAVTAIPEPSTYAAIAGLLALGFVAYRRRKS